MTSDDSVFVRLGKWSKRVVTRDTRAAPKWLRGRPFQALACGLSFRHPSSGLAINKQYILRLTSTMSSESGSWTPAAIPVLRKDCPPLPSPAEIRACANIISERTGQTIVTTNPEIIVKYGLGTPEREGQTLLFLEQYAPEVQAPRLYAMYRDGEHTLIVMERIPGTTLSRVWADLSSLEKKAVCTQLRIALESLRKTTCHGLGFYGAVDESRVPHFLFFSDREND